MIIARKSSISRDNQGRAYLAVHFDEVDQPKVAVALYQVAFDLLHARHLQGLPRDEPGRLIIDLADDLAHHRDEKGAQAELVETHPDQQQRSQRVAGHLAAQADLLAGGAGDVDDLGDSRDHSRMERLVQVRNLGIVAVGGEQVLDQVIGADREEINLAREPRRQPHRRRHLDHDSHFDIGIVLEPFLEQLRLRLLQQLLGAAQLLEAGDHREHDADIVLGRRAENGAQLHLEQPRHLQRDAYRSPAEERVVLARYAHVRRILVGSDIERANRDRPLAQTLEHLAIKRELLSLVGEILVGQERKLRSQQANTLSAVAQRELDVGQQRDIRQHHHAMAVARCGRFITLVNQLFFEGLVPPRQTHVIALDLGAGIDVNHARVAIQHELIAFNYGFHQMFDANHRRNLEGPRENRRMRG